MKIKIVNMNDQVGFRCRISRPSKKAKTMAANRNNDWRVTRTIQTRFDGASSQRDGVIRSEAESL
jgi:hypothetical protein